MRIFGVVVVLVAVLAGLWWWSGVRDGEKPIEMHPGKVLDETSIAGSASAAQPPDESSPSPEITRSEVELGSVGEEREGQAARSGPTSRVFGRVVESSGSGLSGVAIRLHARGQWADGVEEEEFVTETDEEGHFELVVPLPTSDWISMTIEPSRFHAFTGRDFGRAGGRNQDPLVEGDNDLGKFTLASTGAIAGVVHGSSGRTPVGGRVRLDGSFPGGYSIGGPVEESGRYLIGHVPPGTYDIEAIAKGFLVGKLGSIEVRAQAVSEGHDFVLEPAPAISGRVIDEEGAPIDGVRVWGWPVGSGQGAGARTDTEGHFTIYLPQDEPYSLEGGKLGYDAFGGRFVGEKWTFDPGTSDIEIVLRRAVETTFVVVSAASGEPVERFGLSISRRSGELWSSSTAKDDQLVQDVPGGVVTLFAEPEEQSYSIQAPGFAPRHEPVAHDSPESPRQTIRLETEGRIRGRVLYQGRPVARADVRVERCLFLPPGVERSEDLWDDGRTYDLDAYVGRLRMHATDARGVFEVGELATGTYRVTLSAAVGSPRSEELLRVTAGETLDLGDLELITGGTVRGRVIVGVGASAPGLEVFLDGHGDQNRTTVAADGTFEFGGLAPGEHSLVVDDTPGIVLYMEPLVFRVDPGETKDVVLDLTPWQPCRLLVRVREATAPLAGASIMARSDGERSPGQIGTTNAAGELQLDRPAGSAILIDVDSPDGLYLGGSSEPAELPPGGDVVVDLQVRPGELAVELPGGYELPEYGQLSLLLTCEEQPRADRGLQFFTESMESPGLGRVFESWIGRRRDLGPIAPGRYEVMLDVRSMEKAREILRGEVEVSPGADALCTLRVE